MYKHVAHLKTLDKRTDTIISETGMPQGGL